MTFQNKYRLGKNGQKRADAGAASSPPPSVRYNLNMSYVYILRNIAKRSLYIGYTKDLRRRFAEHSQTKVVELIYYESYNNDKLARERERKLKHYGSAWRGLKRRLGLA